jgi:hypothetical protein
MALHAPLLRLPYFWDEAGYYVPAARDLFLHGSLIPQSSVSNAHPPLVMAYLALWWKLAGFAPVVTRTAMLLFASFSLLGLFRLAETVANRQVAIATTLLTAVYPVFFAQSSLVHLDLAAAGLTFWGLYAYMKGKGWEMALWLSLASLTKETAILAPLALLVWDFGSRLARFKDGNEWRLRFRRRLRNPLLLLVPLGPLAAWYAYHYSRTGFVFGNPEFFRYNVEATVHPLRVGLALLVRLWQTFGYFHLLLLTLAMLLAMRLPPLTRLARGTPADRLGRTVRHALSDDRVRIRYGLGRRCGIGALHAPGSSAGDSGLCVDAVAQSSSVAGRGGNHRPDVRAGMVYQSTLRLCS